VLTNTDTQTYKYTDDADRHVTTEV